MRKAKSLRRRPVVIKPYKVGDSAGNDRRCNKEKIVEAIQMILRGVEHHGDEGHKTQCQEAQRPGQPFRNSWLLIDFHRPEYIQPGKPQQNACIEPVFTTGRTAGVVTTHYREINSPPDQRGHRHACARRAVRS